MLSIEAEEELELLVVSNMKGDRKLDQSVSTKLLTGSDVLFKINQYFQFQDFKITKKKNFLRAFLIKVF